MLRYLLALVAALTMASPAAAQGAEANKVFPDSRLVVRDRLSVEVVGDGPDVVFIPGLSSSRATWKGDAERLRKTHRLHLVQIAGFAGEPPRANAEGEVFVPTAEAINAYLVDQKLAPATVVGHSLGGSMALYLAQKHPQHVRKALIVDSLPFLAMMMGGPQATVEGVKPVAARIRDGMAKGGKDYETGVRAQIARMATSDSDKKTIVGWGLITDPSVAARAFYELLLLDQRPGMASVKVPLTVLYPDNVAAGAAPGMMDMYYGGAWKPVPGVKLRRIDRSLHFIMLDQPTAFSETLDAFLKE